MNNRRQPVVHWILIDEITVLNPRSRGQKKFVQIAANITKLGLKKPITVALSNGSVTTKYLLVCGQGRLETFQQKGLREIPAIIVEGTNESLLLMSLAENLARRRHSAAEQFKAIDVMKQRGDSFAEIAKKTDLDVGYIRGIIQLLNKGEERLLQAVEKGQVPIGIAITIARSDDQEIQKVLTEAYENHNLRGRALLRARRLIESRRVRGKGFGGPRPKTNGEEMSADQLMKVYRKETIRQRLFIQRARVCDTRLVFASTAIKQLLRDDNFMNLLRAESLDTIPQYLVVPPDGGAK
jgi:ParB family chromosome partitioning protein